MTRAARLSASMTVTQFDHGYWYATELKRFAKEIAPSCARAQFGNLLQLARRRRRPGTSNAASASISA